MSPVSDEELVARCKKELPVNTSSYEELVQRYMNRVYSFVYRVVPHKEEAEDITQEVLVKVYHGIKKFEQQASFSTSQLCKRGSSSDGSDRRCQSPR